MLDIYVYDGMPSGVHKWFKVINIAGKLITPQELRNTTYTRMWLSDVKIYFSKSICAAYNMIKNYISDLLIRQEYLETAIKWIVNRDELDFVEEYIALYQHYDNINQIRIYLKRVIEWVQTIFPKYRREMKSID